MRMNLKNDLVVKGLKAQSKQYYAMSDDKAERGFGVLVYPTGTKVFIYRYMVDNEQRMYMLGQYGVVSLADAREDYKAKQLQVRALRKNSKDGADPALEKRMAAETRKAAELARKSELTFDELAKEYIENNITGHVVDRSEYDIKRVLLAVGKKDKPTDVDDFKEWRNRKASSITHEEAATLLKNVTKRSAASARNIVKAVRPMFVYAVARGITQTNPFEMGKVKTFLPKAAKAELKPTVKDRVLTQEEIKTVWQALSSSNIVAASKESRTALKLMLLTGQRPTEVLGMDSAEISDQWWTLPKERTKARLDKNRRDHAVYLVPEALSLIGSRKGKLFVYVPPPRSNKPGQKKPAKPVTTENKNPITVGSISLMIRRNNYFGLAPWGAHDLRRTVRTYLADMDGVSANAAEALLNHAQEGVKRNYDHHNYKRQIQNALTLWRDKLMKIIDGPLVPEQPDNVISVDFGKQRANDKG